MTYQFILQARNAQLGARLTVNSSLILFTRRVVSDRARQSRKKKKKKKEKKRKERRSRGSLFREKGGGGGGGGENVEDARWSWNGWNDMG